MPEFTIDKKLSKVDGESIIYLIKFSFLEPISVDDFCEKAQFILYDEIGSAGNFRMAPKYKADLTEEFVECYGEGARITEYLACEDKTLVVAFNVSSGAASLDEELVANAYELGLFCKEIGASVEQLDIDLLYSE